MARKKNRSEKKVSPNNRQRLSDRNPLQYQTLELRQLLAGDVLPALPFQSEPIRHVFSQDAVTVEQMVERAKHRPFVQDQLIVAVELGAAKIDSPDLLAQFNWQMIIGIEGVQPIKTLMTTETGVRSSVSLVQLDLGQNADIVDAMYQLDEYASVLWSSPNFYQLENPVEYIPNDPQYGSQYHHPLMQNDDAWDFTLGDPSIVVGITDDGVDLDHEDLTSNIWVNAGEIAGNGVDDDSNGYIDDVFGWDFANASNDPNPDQAGHDHGTHVAGIAAGDTDNGVGIAGTAGGATIMALQFYRYDSSAWTAAVINETFIYGVDNGANILSTSYNMDGWVGDPVVTAGYQYIQDNGVIHFNSAGNGSSANPPRQAFEQTLLVVSTDANDVKSSFSNYGTGVDISAPGSNIFSTVLNNGYGTKSGTSMAAPNAAGVAALIWSQNPTWNRDQVIAQLLGTADNIDSNNPGLAGLLGAGRVNSFNGMTQTLAAPQVEALVGLPADGETTTDLDIDGFNIRFNQYMDPVEANNPANFAVIEAGADGIFDTGDDQVLPTTLASAYMLGSNSINIEFSNGPLGFGDYRVSIVSGGLQNPFGTDLDGDGNSIPGDDFSLEFTIVPPPPVSIQPAGSLIYQRSFSDSLGSAGENDLFSIELDPGQTISVGVVGFSGMFPRISITDPNGVGLGDVVGPGSSVALNSAPVTVAGEYSILVFSEANMTGPYDVQLLINGAVELESHGGGDNNSLGNAEDINGTSVTLGSTSDRLAVVGQLPSPLGTEVYGDTFDSGVFGPGWTTASTSSFGRTQLTGDFGTAGGAAAMVMDVENDAEYNLNEAVWTVDLSNVTDPVLAFYYAEWSDETNPIPSSFVGSALGDGVAVSDDGTTWYTVLNSPDSSSGIWTEHVVDLADVANTYGLTLGPDFQIKFQQYDNFSLTTDGRGYDEIKILSPEVNDDWYQFDLNDGGLATIAATALNSAGSASIELYDSAGNLIQAGIAGQNVSSQIRQFADTTKNGEPDSYFVRVFGANTDYSLIVTRDADFDLEPNDLSTEAQDISNVAGVLGYVSAAQNVAADPDDFSSGTILDNAFPGVTLSNNVGGGSVYSELAEFGAPTGTQVFAPAPGQPQGWSDDADELRADFDQLQGFVSIDVGSDDSSDVGFLRAYDASGNLLEQVTSGPISTGGSETISITRATADIAYIIASGLGGDITPLDNLQFTTQGTDDFYSFNVQAGELIQINGILPGQGPYHFENGLDNGTGSDLILELYDPNDLLVASGVETVSYLANLPGEYQVRVSTAGGSGEYYLERDPGVVTPAGIDFGPVGSPIWPTYAAVSDEAYDSRIGYGWLGPIDGFSAFEEKNGNDLTRDKVILRTGTFVIDVDNGIYNVDVVLGRVKKADEIQITIEGNADKFVPDRGSNVIRSYLVTVDDGQLTFDLDGTAGSNDKVKISGIAISEAAGRIAGPTTTDSAITDLLSGWLDGYQPSLTPIGENPFTASMGPLTQVGQQSLADVASGDLAGSQLNFAAKRIDLDEVLGQQYDFGDFEIEDDVLQVLEESLTVTKQKILGT